MSTYNTPNYRKIGGQEWVVGGTLTLDNNCVITKDGNDISAAVGYLNGVTSNIQTQITAKESVATAQSIVAAGALSTSIAVSTLSLVGAGAVTLAVPTVMAMTKVIKMLADNGDVTLALTNVVGQSSGTTCTFNDVGDTLVLISDVVSGKWVVVAEVGVTLA